ncbi:MAG: WXG100 family type VII secretion target [Mogibacterium sp.]|nr:WXG100 family type VII secretion target [Mogibacterium sp.]
MAELSVIISELNSKAEELNALNQQFYNQVGTLEETEGALNGMWEGEARTQFHTAFTNDVTQMHNFYNAVAMYVQVLINAVEKYQIAESRNVDVATTRRY